MAEIQKQKPPVDELDHGFIRLLVIVVLFTVAVVLFVMSLALMEDISTLSKAPELVWAFICGAPSETGPALPLMLTLTTLAFLGGIAILVWHIWKQRHLVD